MGFPASPLHTLLDPTLLRVLGQAQSKKEPVIEVAVTTETLIPPLQNFFTGTSPVQATGRVSSQSVMRVTGTSSAQTASCGHREIQQGLLVKQDYQLQRVAGDTGIS